MGDHGLSRNIRCVVARAMPHPFRMHRKAARRHLYRDDIRITDAGVPRSMAHRLKVILNQECLRLRRFAPLVGAAHVEHGARIRSGVGERHPERRHDVGHHVVIVAAVLVHDQPRRARRLPDDIVEVEPGSFPAGELGGDAADRRLENDTRYRIVGLPCIAELSRSIIPVPPVLPVHLVWSQTRFPPAVEQRLKPRFEAIYFV